MQWQYISISISMVVSSSGAYHLHKNYDFSLFNYLPGNVYAESGPASHKLYHSLKIIFKIIFRTQEKKLLKISRVFGRGEDSDPTFFSCWISIFDDKKIISTIPQH